jgi:hypothetical protein
MNIKIEKHLKDVVGKEITLKNEVIGYISEYNEDSGDAKLTLINDISNFFKQRLYVSSRKNELEGNN